MMMVVVAKVALMMDAREELASSLDGSCFDVVEECCCSLWCSGVFVFVVVLIADGGNESP